MASRQGKPKVTWLGRFVRGHRLDRNPLRRAYDRAETALLAMLIAAFLAGAPFAAMASGAWAHAAGVREQAAQEASRHMVPAMTLTAASPGTPGDSPVLASAAKARWLAPDGAMITDEIAVPPGTAAGAMVRIWVVRNGTQAEPPLLDSQVSDQAILAEVGAVTALAITLTVTGALGRRSLDKRRMAAWDAEWRAAGPSWTKRA
jgi:hypothetical protein